MWLSKKTLAQTQKDEAMLGRVTLGGNNVGVYAKNERRGVKLFAPKGFIWKPKTGEKLFVVDLQDGCAVALGVEMENAPTGMRPGEVFIKSETASILLKNDGNITISGNVNVEGSLSVNGLPIA